MNDRGFLPTLARRVNDKDFGAYERWAKNFALDGNLKAIYFPYNLRGNHWILFSLHINYDGCCAYPLFRYYDSMNSLSRHDMIPIRFDIQRVFQQIPMTNGITHRGSFHREKQILTPQQKDGCNCGFYVLKKINVLALGDTDGDFDPAVFRRLVKDVLTYKIQRATRRIQDATRIQMEKIVAFYRERYRRKIVNQTDKA